VLNASVNNIDDAVIASLPPSLDVLVLECCSKLSAAASFAHLTCLRTLNLYSTPISSATLATLPPSLVSLDLSMYPRRYLPANTGAGTFVSATVFPHLPALRVLNVNYTGVGDAAIASMPAGLEELTMVCCHNVTQCASLDHLTALQVLQSSGTDLPPATIAACRARGCFAPADGKVLHNKGGWEEIDSLVSLPDGRLVTSSSFSGHVALWEVATGHGAEVAQLELRDMCASALAVLHDGQRVAIGVGGTVDAGPVGIVVWDTRDAPHDTRVITSATIVCASDVKALAVAADGHLVAGSSDGTLRVVDVGAGVIVATVTAHARAVRAVAVLVDGRVASASDDRTVKLWDVGTWTCASTLAGHTGSNTSLAALPDGRLASGSFDYTVRLWDAGSGTCIRMLTDHQDFVSALTAVPGDQLASLSTNGTILVKQ